MSKLLSRQIERADVWTRKALWRIRHDFRPQSTPVFIGGIQRSGTTMLGDCLGRSPEIRHYPEHDPAAFDDFMLRDDDTVARLIATCPFRYVVFKPLTDSHRVVELARRFSGRTVWMYRRHEDRANSAVAKFGAHNLEVLSRIAVGEGMDAWQARGLSEENLALVREFDYGRMRPEDAAALMWYLRNDLFFQQGMAGDDAAWLVAYESFVHRPEQSMQSLCRFLGAAWRPALVKGVHRKSVARRESAVSNERIDELCNRMYERLEEVRQAKEARQAASTAA